MKVFIDLGIIDGYRRFCFYDSGEIESFNGLNVFDSPVDFVCSYLYGGGVDLDEYLGLIPPFWE